MLDDFHNLLKRQINKHVGEKDKFLSEHQNFVKAINDTYCHTDEEREMSERSMEISSQELIQRNSELQAIFKAFPDIFVRLDKDGKILAFKSSNTYDLPFAFETPVGKYVECLPINNAVKIFQQAWQKVEATSKVVTIEHFWEVEGKKFYFELRFQKLFEDQLIVIIRNVTNTKLAQQQLRHDALHDKLTDLPNRTLLMDRLGVLVERAKRNNDYRFAVLFVDFDRFKVINDSLGHVIGDQLLKQIAERLRKIFYSVDTIARIGGDEFSILLDDIESEKNAIAAAERLQEALSEPFFLANKEIFITTSIGIVMNDGKSVFPPAEYLRNADIAMYHAKQDGKAKYKIFNAEMHSKAMEILDLESELRKAIEQQQFSLNYQPILSLKDKSVVRMEALIRWIHPERGMISPIEFIPLAEETGLIFDIGEWVLDKACEQARLWQDQGCGQVGLAINFSALQFHHQDLPRLIFDAITRHGINPHVIEVEITESVAMRDISYSIKVLNKLKQLGVSIAIDDFGIGYSSLGSLANFPIDSLKVDRTFIKGIPQNKDSATLASAMIALAHKLGLSVVGEGIETEEQLSFLNTQDCDEGQGYLFARPLPADEATQFLQQHNS